MLINLQPGRLIEPLTGRSWTGEEVISQVFMRVRRYHGEGVSTGDRVFVHCGNRMEFFADLLALWRLGASCIPIDGRLTAFEVGNLAQAVSPRYSLVDSRTDPALVRGMASLGAKIINTPEQESGAQALTAVPAGQVRLENEALILFTSGSTGTPKGVVHTHRSLRARWLALQSALGTEHYQRALCLLPTHFGHGLICNSLFPWLSGGDLFIVPPFNTNLIMQLGQFVDEHQITFLSSVPSMWSLTLKASKTPQRRSLRRIHCGSAPLAAHLWRQIQQWSGTSEVFNAYGITETGSWIAGTTVPEFTPEEGLIGAPWGALFKILKTRDGGALFNPDLLCARGEAGHIWVNTAGLMSGYFEQQELTDQVVCDGWFLTGDIGFLDDRGWLYLMGREREEINKGGSKIYPADIEAVVRRFTQTKEVCAFAASDALYGQTVAMAVVLARDDDATLRSLYQWMKNRLADFKLPALWYLVDELPKTSSGKVNRGDVQKNCAPLTPVDLQKILRIRN